MHYSRMTEQELLDRAGQARAMIAFVKSKGAWASKEQKWQQKTAETILREIQKELNSRITQLPLL